ncbi:MAG: DinB family protein [Dokdonella sp.]
MSVKSQFELMARYNQWMNAKIYAASAQLDALELHADKGAFFGSVFGTLNHLLVADTIWMKRFADHPATFRALQPVRPMPHPYSLAQALHSEFASLRSARVAMDEVILALVAEATDADYAQSLTYANSKGEVFVDPFGPLLQHVFNHQTHHRGQITTLLSQAGFDVGVTDLVTLVRAPHAA